MRTPQIALALLAFLTVPSAFAADGPGCSAYTTKINRYLAEIGPLKQEVDDGNQFAIELRANLIQLRADRDAACAKSSDGDECIQLSEDLHLTLEGGRDSAEKLDSDEKKLAKLQLALGNARAEALNKGCPALLADASTNTRQAGKSLPADPLGVYAIEPIRDRVPATFSTGL